MNKNLHSDTPILDADQVQRQVFDFEETAEDMRAAIEARNAALLQRMALMNN